MGVIGYLIATMTHKVSQYTGSYELQNKKFSDVKAFMMSKDYAWSPAAKVRRNTDTSNTWDYEWGTDLFVIRTKIVHYGEYIKSCVIFSEEEGAEYIQQSRMKNLMKKVPDSKVEPQDESTAAPAGEDYSALSNQELLEVFDKKTVEFGKNPCEGTFQPLEEIRNVLGDRVDEVPLSARGGLSKCLSDIDMYLPSIRTQLGMRFPNGTTAATSSAPTYVPKIRAAIAELASLMQ